MKTFFERNKPTSYIMYTFTDKTTLQITVASNKTYADTSHRIYGKDIHTKRFKFDLSISDFEALIKGLEDVQESFDKLEQSGKTLLIGKCRWTYDELKQTSQGYYIKANTPEILMDFVDRLKKANTQISAHLSENLLAKVQTLELDYEDTLRAIRSAP